MVTTRARAKRVRKGDDTGQSDPAAKAIAERSGSSANSEGNDAGSGDQGLTKASSLDEAGGSPDADLQEKVGTDVASEEPAAKQAKTSHQGDASESRSSPEHISPTGEDQSQAESPKGTTNNSVSGDVLADSKDPVESGKVFFFYRPRVGLDHVGKLEDVQRFYLLLEPSQPGSKSRLIVIGKKRLPAISNHERYFAFVEAVAEDKGTLLQGMGVQRYQTTTMGERVVGACRAAGEGAYSILEHGSGTNFVYRLELPTEPGEAQRMCGIELEGSFGLSVKNPNKTSNPAVGLREKADLPEALENEFQGYAWIAARDPKLLDYERVELLFVGASKDLAAELGSAGAQVVEVAKADEGNPEELKREIHAEEIGLQIEPAETGEVV
ncbi:hypothetical protein ACKKBF_B14555 [Auxenochlorella protothecoides x Auxenochlorella symbiontica]